MTNDIEYEITKYIVISSTNNVDFERQIEEHLRDGWMLHGGLQLHVNSGVWYFAQALTKSTVKDTRGAWG